VSGVTLAVDPFSGVAHMLGHPFVQHAVAAGTAIALLSGLVGYFVVLRGQVFAGDPPSHVAFAGAVRWPRLPPVSTCASGCSRPPSSWERSSGYWAGAVRPTMS
jgi:hypothetical protein